VMIGLLSAGCIYIGLVSCDTKDTSRRSTSV